MPTAGGLKRYLTKRGLRVSKVEINDIAQFVVYVDYPKRAREIMDGNADQSNVTFVMRKRWWQKILFWRK